MFGKRFSYISFFIYIWNEWDWTYRRIYRCFFTLFRPCDVTGVWKSIQYLLEFALHVLPLVHILCVVPSPGVRVAVAESLIRDLGRVSEWCDLWGMKLNASKTKTMIVSRSSTMHPQSPPLTIDGTVLKESDDIVILRVTFDSKMTFEKHLRSVSRAASQRLGIMRKS